MDHDNNIALENPSQPCINDTDLSKHHDFLSRFQSLQQSLDTIQTKSSLMEENLRLSQQQRDDALNNNSELKLVSQQVSLEKDSLCYQMNELKASFKEKEDGFLTSIDEPLLEVEKLEKEMGVLRETSERLELEMKEAKERNGFLFMISMDSLRPVKDSLIKVIVCVDNEKVTERFDYVEKREESELDDEWRVVLEEFKSTTGLASETESRVNVFKEIKKKEKKELENRVESLTEENRDINSLLRVALVEKEAVEKSLNQLKVNTEQKRVVLLQIAERGLQRVGFGFMMGSGSSEQSADDSGGSTTATTASNKSDSSECEEEVVTLVIATSASASIELEFGVAE